MVELQCQRHLKNDIWLSTGYVKHTVWRWPLRAGLGQQFQRPCDCFGVWGHYSNSWVKLMNAAHTKYLMVIQISFQNSLQSTPSCFDVLANTHCKVKYTKKSPQFWDMCCDHVIVLNITVHSVSLSEPVEWSEQRKKGSTWGYYDHTRCWFYTNLQEGVFFLLFFPVIQHRHRTRC